MGVLSQFIQNPGPAHWEGAKRVITYLGSMRDLWLTFGGNKDVLLEGYSDSDWASHTHRHLISGYSFNYGWGTVLWSLKKQNIIALSSTKAEYIVQTHAAKEGIWLKSFINKIRGGEEGPLTIMADNQGTITLAKDNKFHSGTKHINLQYHFICEAVEDERARMEYMPTSGNIADIFTKALAKPKFTKFIGRLGLAMMKD